MRIAGLAILLALTASHAYPRDLDGRFAQSPLKPWFDQLKSGKGLCCSVADGVVIEDADWTTARIHECNTNNECHTIDGYRVKIEGRWLDVPSAAVITEPNLSGRTMVWPMQSIDGLTIRCFMPGVMG